MKKTLSLLVLCSMMVQVAAKPLLLIPEGGVDDMKKLVAEDKRFARLHDFFVDDCESIIDEPTLERIQEGRRLLAVSREALERIMRLGYVYLMTDDTHYAERAVAEMVKVCQFSDWNPSHYLDVAEMSMAVAIGYSWCGDYLAQADQAEHKKVIEDGLYKHALSTAKFPDGKWRGVFSNKINWNPVCNAGIAFSAIVLHDMYPEVADDFLVYAQGVNPNSLTAYGPDGGYPEGPMYWGYGTNFQVMFFLAMEQYLGKEIDMSQYPGFLESARFMQFMVMPTGLFYGYSDSHVCHAEISGMQYWFANRTGDASLLYLEDKLLERDNVVFTTSRLAPMIMLLASQMDMGKVKQPKGDTWYTQKGPTPVFVYRSGWKSEKDVYLGVKAGQANHSHGHMDAGSFVYQRDGVDWSVELGSQDYYSLEKEGVTLFKAHQDSERWGIFRLSPWGHTCLIVNDERHKANGRAELTEVYTEDKNKKGAKMDLSQVLIGVEAASRAVWVDRRGDLTVVDDVETPVDEQVKLRWQMMTEAVGSVVDARTIRLEKDGRVMWLKVDVPEGLDVKLNTWDAVGDKYYDAPNLGMMRVGYEVMLPAGMTQEIRVTLKKQL